MRLAGLCLFCDWRPLGYAYNHVFLGSFCSDSICLQSRLSGDRVHFLYYCGDSACALQGSDRFFYWIKTKKTGIFNFNYNHIIALTMVIVVTVLALGAYVSLSTDEMYAERFSVKRLVNYTIWYNIMKLDLIKLHLKKLQPHPAQILLFLSPQDVLV